MLLVAPWSLSLGGASADRRISEGSLSQSSLVLRRFSFSLPCRFRVRQFLSRMSGSKGVTSWRSSSLRRVKHMEDGVEVRQTLYCEGQRAASRNRLGTVTEFVSGRPGGRTLQSATDLCLATTINHSLSK